MADELVEAAQQGNVDKLKVLLKGDLFSPFGQESLVSFVVNDIK